MNRLLYENRRLKQLVADLNWEVHVAKHVHYCRTPKPPISARLETDGHCQCCIRCRVSTRAVETQTVAAFSPGLRVDSVFRARSSSGKLSALLLG